MDNRTVEETARAAAHELLLAWLISLQPEIDLTDTRRFPNALVTMDPPETVSEQQQDLWRVVLRDASSRVLSLAAVMRGQLPP